MNDEKRPDPFNPYKFLDQVNGRCSDEDGRVFLSNEYRASDLGTMLKTALISIQILSQKINEK